MQGKFLTVALDKTDYTIQLVRESMMLNVNLLAQDQAKKLISKLGRKSGLTSNKFVNLPFEMDDRGCPYLKESIGYVQCKCVGSIDSGDHELFVCEVLKQITLNPDKEVLTNNYLRDNGLVRG
jgi:flavin reductase (DIM6/NTAB) family NADH-FMN oxidoreductase RutF